MQITTCTTRSFNSALKLSWESCQFKLNHGGGSIRVLGGIKKHRDLFLTSLFRRPPRVEMPAAMSALPPVGKFSNKKLELGLCSRLRGALICSALVHMH